MKPSFLGMGWASYLNLFKARLRGKCCLWDLAGKPWSIKSFVRLFLMPPAKEHCLSLALSQISRVEAPLFQASLSKHVRMGGVRERKLLPHNHQQLTA